MFGKVILVLLIIFAFTPVVLWLHLYCDGILKIYQILNRGLFKINIRISKKLVGTKYWVVPAKAAVNLIKRSVAVSEHRRIIVIKWNNFVDNYFGSMSS